MEFLFRREDCCSNNPIRLVQNALCQLDDFLVSETFGETFYNLLVCMNGLPFEGEGTILDLFKSSTPLSPKAIDDFMNGKFTDADREKIFQITLTSAVSPYMDPRYLKKLSDNGYMSVSKKALDEFGHVICAIRKGDTISRDNLISELQIAMEGEPTVEPHPVKRTYKTVKSVINKFRAGSLVYFSPEMKLIGGTRSIFSGGLGVLAGEYIEGLANTGVTTYGVTLRYEKSIVQRISPYGISTTIEIPVDYSKLPVFDTGVVVEENIMGSLIQARVWEIPAGPARVFALEDLTSDITEMLYGGEKETLLLRERQNQLLGRAGIKVITELLKRKIIDKKPIMIHLNEANCYCALDEVQKRQMLKNKPDSVWNNIGIAFTTHTPVPAGLPMVYSHTFSTNDLIHLSWELNTDPITLMVYYVKYLDGRSWGNLEKDTQERLISFLESGRYGDFSNEIRKIAGDNIVLNLTEATAALSDGSTSVSLRHEQVTNLEIIRNSNNSPSRHDKSYQPTTGITNGVNIRDWQPPEFQNVDYNNLSAQLLLAVKRKEKEEYIEMVNNRTGSRLSPEHLTISVMRRINTYKRTDLIIREIDLLVEELGDEEINIIFSGIPHSKDEPAQKIFKRILDAVNWKHPNLHVAFICQYDISVAKYAIRGSDVWLMQPIEKKEASSTSHQKALGAGTLIVSTYDGAMIENVVDMDVDPDCANGAFITPLITYRLILKNEVETVNLYTEQGNGENGYFSRPIIKTDGDGEYTPVAVIDKGERYIVVDEIIPDLSKEKLKSLVDNPSDRFNGSPIFKVLKKSISTDGRLSAESFHDLMYATLDPFSTYDLHRMYDCNPQPWCRMLYSKLGKLAKFYTGIKYGDPRYGAQWFLMMRNAIQRTYEVDIHRMALEYIRDIYDHILISKRNLITDSFPDERLLELAVEWRRKFAEDKAKEVNKKNLV